MRLGNRDPRALLVEIESVLALTSPAQLSQWTVTRITLQRNVPPLKQKTSFVKTCSKLGNIFVDVKMHVQIKHKVGTAREKSLKPESSDFHFCLL